MRSEKQSEKELSCLLEEKNFNNNNIYYSPAENKILEELFKDSSKTGDKNEYKLINTKTEILCLEAFNLKQNNNNIITREEMDKEIHKIHDYIRNHTKISNGNKPFLIACILICFKNEIFINTVVNLKSNTKNIYIVIKDILRDYEIETNIFDFLETSKDKTHFYTLIKMIYDVYFQNPSIDLLNSFYSEFVKYSNTDSKSLGIVLTPEHIVKLMIYKLNITKDDTILDLCTGTGSFLIEAHKYNPKLIMGCEYDNSLYGLLKCNMILRNIKNYKLYKNDCFKEVFKATKSIINPPYSTKGENELDFVLKQLHSIEEHGIAASIIPISVLGNYKDNRKKLLKMCKIKKIIKCNPVLFYPEASVSTLILIVEKNKEGHNFKHDEIEYTDYSNDEIEIKKQRGKIKTDKFEERYKEILNKVDYKKLIDEKDEWWHSPIKINNDISIQDIKMQKINIEINKLNQIKNVLNLQEKNLIQFENTKEFKIGDLFNISKGKAVISKTKPGKFPLVSSSGINNGIVGTSIDSLYSKNTITIAVNGSVGSCFYQTTDYIATTDVAILSLKDYTLNEYIAMYLCLVLENYKQKYSYSRKWNITRMKNDTIILPIKNNNIIDWELIERKIFLILEIG